MPHQSVYYTEEEQECHARELTQAEKKKLAIGQCNYLLLMLLSFAAYVLSQYTCIDCNFAQRAIRFYNGMGVSDVCAQANLNSFEEPACETFLGTHGVGFYSWMGTIPVNQQVCLSYTMCVPETGWITPTFDTAFNAAKVFAVLASIFGAVGWLSVMFASCCGPVSQERLKGLGCYFGFACVCQSFTFLVHGSSVCGKGFFQQYFPTVDVNNAIQEVTCSLGEGGKRSVAAAVLYGICSVLALYAIAPGRVRYSRSSEEATEKTSQSTDPEAQEEQP